MKQTQLLGIIFLIIALTTLEPIQMMSSYSDTTLVVLALDMKYQPPGDKKQDKKSITEDEIEIGSRDKCLKNVYQNKNLMNQDVEMQFCFEHSGRTCCGQRDASKIRTKLSIIRKKTNPKI